jgi:nitrogen fixation protein FixH
VWPAAILGLLGLNMAVCAVTIYNAVSDPSVATEPEYYTRAMNWDEERGAWPDASALGLRTAVSVDVTGASLTVRLTDEAGKPVAVESGVGEAFHRARGRDRRELTFGPVEHGVAAAAVRVDRAGLWEVRARLTTARGPVSVRDVIEVAR